MRKLIFTCALCASSTFLVSAKNIEQQNSPKLSSPVPSFLQEVINGNTFAESGMIMQLWGIDVPQENDKYFLASKLYLETLLTQASHSCHYKYKDIHGRLVMQCFADGKDIAIQLVRMGLARDLEKYSKGLYKADEKYAQINKYGMWEDGLKELAGSKEEGLNLKD